MGERPQPGGSSRFSRFSRVENQRDLVHGPRSPSSSPSRFVFFHLGDNKHHQPRFERLAEQGAARLANRGEVAACRQQGLHARGQTLGARTKQCLAWLVSSQQQRLRTPSRFKHGHDPNQPHRSHATTTNDRKKDSTYLSYGILKHGLNNRTDSGSGTHDTRPISAKNVRGW